MSEKLWYLKQCPLFDRVGSDDVSQVEKAGKARRFPRGEPIYLPAEEASSVLLLVSGRAKICHLTPDGKQSILAFIESGELFGELAILEHGNRDEYAEAVETSVVVMIPADVIQQLLERRLKNLLFLSNRERLTHLLLELAEQYGARQADGVRLRIQLSHQDLANIIGSTRETVTVVLGELQQEGLVEIGRRRVVLKDLERLAGSVQRSAPLLSAVTVAGT